MEGLQYRPATWELSIEKPMIQYHVFQDVPRHTRTGHACSVGSPTLARYWRMMGCKLGGIAAQFWEAYFFLVVFPAVVMPGTALPSGYVAS